MPASVRPQRWDIFCTVVDNFGDIGVCWRLARQLANEHGVELRLWVDDLAAFAHLCPEIDVAHDRQRLGGVDIWRWRQHFPEVVAPADVVIEAFACQLPESYVDAMARRESKPHWINLEYLSAEDWVAGCHGLPSPHPQLPLTKHFFIPGFDSQSGGLLREQDVLARHASFDAADWWGAHGGASIEGTLSVSLFAYENRAVSELLAAWREGVPPIRCLVTESRILTSVSAAMGEPLASGDRRLNGKLD